MTTAFNPTNAINVNSGGTLSLRGAATPSGLVTLNSGSIIAANTGTVTFTSGTNVSVPTTGVLFNNSSAGVTLTNAYPAFTGTMAFGGNGSGSITTSAATTTTGAQTLAFNQTGAGQMIFNGLALGGTLTITGSGNNSVAGAIPQGTAASLGTVSGAQGLVLSMAPTGAISMSQQTSGVSSITLQRGTLAIDGGNTIGIKAGGTVNLNGGTIRNQNGANNNSTWQDAISVGANGGTI